MAKFLVASLKHELLPIAHRLKREGHEVQVCCWRTRYESAWGGYLEKIARHSDGTIAADFFKDHIEAANKGELAVITTVRRVAELFHAAKHLYAVAEKLTEAAPRDRLLLGGWFSGEEVQAPHLLVADWGVWPGGLGPQVMGGATLVRVEKLPGFIEGALNAATDRMKSAGFKGLFHFDVKEVPASGELRLRGLAAGWPFLHSHAFLAELEAFGEVIPGLSPVLKRKFVCVIPITIPPWPNEKRSDEAGGEVIQGLTIQQQAQCFWFDVRIAQEQRQLFSAGLDGLLAIATGCSDSTPALARARALDLAHKLTVPEKQARFDMGASVDAVLSTLEDRYGFVV